MVLVMSVLFLFRRGDSIPIHSANARFTATFKLAVSDAGDEGVWAILEIRRKSNGSLFYGQMMGYSFDTYSHAREELRNWSVDVKQGLDCDEFLLRCRATIT
jgi:hypothetical protein